MRRNIRPVNFKSQVVVLAVVLAVAQSPAAGLAGETNAPVQTNASVVTVVKDFSKGFAAFGKLGMPDVSKAEYVNLTSYSAESYSMMESRLYELNLAGNAWMLEETPKVKGRFVMGNLQIVDIYDSEGLAKEQRKKWEDAMKTNKGARAVMNFPDEQDERISGQWKKVDLKKDLDKTVAFLGKMEKSGNRFDPFAYNNDSYGTLFLNAFHYHSKGFTNEANLIVAKLFERAGDPKKVIGQAMDKMASQKYNAALKVFKADGNWEAFGAAIDAVAAQFATSWKQAPAVRKLSGLIKQRATLPQAPALTGEGLTDEDKALAEELAKAAPVKKSRYYRNDSGLWILPMPPRPGLAVRPAEKDVIARIRQKGIKAVPMLIALLKDEYLIRLDTGDINQMNRYNFNLGLQRGRGESGEAMLEEMFKSMARPAMRGDIARDLLKPLLLRKADSGGGSSDVEGDDLIEEIKAWYATCKNKTPVELAGTYLDGGDDNQQRLAVQYLMKVGKEADLEKVEKHFLSGKRSRMDMYIVREYVQGRGDKAKAFVEKYEAFVKNGQSGPDDNNEMFKNDDARKQLETELASLKELVTAGSLKEMLEKVVSGAKTQQEVAQPLYKKLASEKPAEAITALLDAAIKANDAEVSMSLVSLAPYAQRAAGGMASVALCDPSEMAEAAEIDEDEQAPSPEPDKDKPGEKLKPALHAAQWKQLLADKRKLGRGVPGLDMTVADSTATVINNMYGTASEQTRNPCERGPAVLSLGRRSQAIALARAEGLLAGKLESELPRPPTISDATPEKRKLVTEKIMQATEATIAQTVAGLSNEEHLALLLVARKDPKLNAKLATYANTIRDIQVEATLAPAVKEIESAKDKVLNREVVDKALAACTRFAGEGKIVHCLLTRRTCLEGVSITFKAVTPGSKEFKEMLDAGLLRADQPAEVSGSVADTGCQGSALWPAGANAAKTNVVAATSQTPEDKLIDRAVGEIESDLAARLVADQHAFWKAVDDFCAGKGNVCRTGVMAFSSKVPVTVPPKVPVAQPADAGVHTSVKIISTSSGTTVTETRGVGVGEINITVSPPAPVGN